MSRPWLMIAAACLVVLLSRLPFLWGNPDWGPLWGHEQCFLLSAPEVHTTRMAAEPGTDVPFYLVDPEQFRSHYHGGTVILGRTLYLLSRILDTRSLVLVKLVGTLFTVLCGGLLVWAWTRVFGVDDRAGPATVVFLLSFSPFFFLWASLIPLGHYMESHLFYGLFLPFYVLLARGRLRRLWLVVAGVVAALAIFYVFSNAIFFAVLLTAYLLEPGLTRLQRLKEAALSAGVCGVLLLTLVRPWAIVARIFSSGIWAEGTEELAVTEGWDPVGVVVQRYVDTLLGYNGVLEARFPDLHTEPLGAVAAGLVVALGSFTLLRYVVPSLRRDDTEQTPRRRFLRYHAWLFVAFVGAYALFDPDIGDPSSFSASWYLVPVYPLLFVGCAALARWVAASPRGAVRIAAALAAVPVGGMLVLGWFAAVEADARDAGIPSLSWCDARSIDGYFWEIPGDDAGQVDVVFARDRGEARCAHAHPREEQACALAGYVLQSRPSAGELECGTGTHEHRVLCARAVGTVRYSEPDCAGATEAWDGMCLEFEGEMRRACLSGAAQGNALDFSSQRCMETLNLLCDETFPTGAALAACQEQTAALISMAPLLPAPPEETPTACAHWPRAWLGLCARAVTLAERPAAPWCEDLYAREYARELPAEQSLAFDECLVSSAATYPGCAIGVARQRGETDCSWHGHDE